MPGLLAWGLAVVSNPLWAGATRHRQRFFLPPRRSPFLRGARPTRCWGISSGERRRLCWFHETCQGDFAARKC